MGDGPLLLELPGEDGLRVPPKVCVWAQEGIKEQGHRALAPAFEALRQVIQVLEGSGTGQGPPGEGRRLCIPPPPPIRMAGEAGECCLPVVCYRV